MATLQKHITKNSAALLLLAGLMLSVSIFVPIWRIDLDAPQYPEGLRLLIYANKLGGNVDIINGLNHYIGMKTLHSEDFLEFTVLPYLIGFFAVFSIAGSFIARKRVLYILFTLFVLFGVVAMVDFWRWEYDYGHNLDPSAAIIVPGMAYQPPLIGFKQLLNFGAYSIPSLGGLLFITSGALMLLAVLLETNVFKRITMKNNSLLLMALPMLLLHSCGEVKPQPAKLNTDICDYCKMSITDAKFVSELLTKKGRIYKFDDLVCMQNYNKENPNNDGARLYVADFKHPDSFLEVGNAIFVKGETIGSPMGGNTAAFSDRKAAEQFSEKSSVQIILWSDLRN